MSHNSPDVKEKIIEAARATIAKYGVNNTSLQAIADEAGISKGSLYYHFKTKNSILYSMVDAEFRASKGVVERIRIGELSPEQAQEEIIGAIRDRIFKKKEDNKLHLYLSQEAMLGNQEIKAAYEEKYKDWLSDIAEGFSFAFKLPPDSGVKVLAYLFICLMDGWCMQDSMETNAINNQEVLAAMENIIRGNTIPNLFPSLIK